MARRFFPLLMALSIALAGCSGGEKATPATSVTTTAPPPTVSAETGSIEGVVVDEEQAPIPGVSVALLETQEKQVSDAAGKFVFNNLTGGKFRLVTEKLGFESVARSVDVLVGEVTAVTLTVKAIAVSPEPFVTLLPFEGLLQCSVNPLYPINPCGTSLGADKDRFPFTIDTNHTFEEAVFELVWKPGTSVTGSELELDVCDDLATEDVLCLNASFDEYTEGPSPVVLRITEFPLKEKTQFLTGAGAPQDPPAPVVQQAFTIYVSLCYYAECGESYTAVPA